MNVGDVNVRVGLDTDALDAGLAKTKGKLAGIGAGLGSVGASLTKFVTLPIVAIGAAAVLSANQVDEAYQTIRSGTGATGETLEGLQDSFGNVFTSVPASAGDAATAISELNTRLGLTGKPLEDISAQVLNLSRLTGEDLNAVIQNTTRFMGDWGIAAEDQSRTLDELYNVSQMTGISVSDLANKAVTNGAAMRGMGFDSKTATLLLGKFEKEGVNTEAIMGSLKIGLTRMAKEGITDAGEGFQALSEEIKNAESDTEAITLATDIFGSRAAADMALAIREGRFEIEDYAEALDASGDTINGVAEETMTAAEKMRLKWNEFTMAIEPLGDTILDVFDSSIMPVLQEGIDVLTDLADKFQALDPATQKSIVKLAGFAAIVPPLLIVTGKLITAISAIRTGFLALKATKLGVAAAEGLNTLRLSANQATAALASTRVGMVGLQAGAIALRGAVAAAALAAAQQTTTYQDWRSELVTTGAMIGDQENAWWDLNVAIGGVDAAVAAVNNGAFRELPLSEQAEQLGLLNLAWGYTERAIYNATHAEEANAEATREATWSIQEYKDAAMELANQELMLQDATLRVKESKLRAKEAQDEYTAAVKEFGENSPEAEAKLLALERANLGVEQAELAADQAERDRQDTLKSIPKPNNANQGAWVRYFETLGYKADDAARKARNLLRLLNAVKSGAAQSTSAYSPDTIAKAGLADGKIVTSPEIALIGEAGAEVVVPMSPSKRGRAAELLSAAFPDGLPGSSRSVAPSGSGGGSGTQIIVTGNHIAADYDIDRIGERLVSRLKTLGLAV